MNHEWEDIPPKDIPIMRALTVVGARRCRKCGKKQYKEVGCVKWLPLAGKCKQKGS